MTPQNAHPHEFRRQGPNPRPAPEGVLRAYRESDRDEVIALIDSIYREYGDAVCLDQVDADLLDVYGHYPADGFRVLETGGRLRGTVAVVFDSAQPDVAWLRRLYLHRDLRGTRWGHEMFAWAADTARDRGATALHFWSDTRFTRAHAFYQKLGCIDEGRVRTMDDAWEPYRERFFTYQIEADQRG